MSGFRHYLALGDSISIDRYPGLDVADREDLAFPPDGLGAASLLYRNDPEHWPEFKGQDLSTRNPNISFTNLTRDGATTRTVLEYQLPHIPSGLEEPALVTLTAGGNDLLSLLDANPNASGPTGRIGQELVEETAARLERIIDQLRDRFSQSILIVGTVYDPSDGTGDLGDGHRQTHALEALHAFNDQVRTIADDADAAVAEIHDHFLGHGLSEPDPNERWYLPYMPIEPSARGASEVRRLWSDILTQQHR